MTDNHTEVGNINYSFKKEKSTLFVLFFLIPLFWSIGGWFLSLYLAYVSGKIPDATPEEALISALVSLVMFIPIPIAAILSYAFNKLEISDGYVVIRKGLSGRHISFKTDDVLSFQHAYSRGSKGGSNNKIIFYLKCGKIVRTNDLHINPFELQKLLEILRSFCEGKGYSSSVMKNLASKNGDLPLPKVRINVIPPIIMALPFALALLTFVVYLMKNIL
ncbi:MAG: hypothetical protein K0S55_953 [Clostridia bacterium]|nr:hypothetical protein [Clostridia bacterium]